jgi:hypothetical protein
VLQKSLFRKRLGTALFAKKTQKKWIEIGDKVVPYEFTKMLKDYLELERAARRI